MNLIDVIIVVGLAILVIWVVVRQVSKYKNGESGCACNGGCSTCSGESKCSLKKEGGGKR